MFSCFSRDQRPKPSKKNYQNKPEIPKTIHLIVPKMTQRNSIIQERTLKTISQVNSSVKDSDLNFKLQKDEQNITAEADQNIKVLKSYEKTIENGGILVPKFSNRNSEEDEKSQIKNSTTSFGYFLQKQETEDYKLQKQIMQILAQLTVPQSFRPKMNKDNFSYLKSIRENIYQDEPVEEPSDQELDQPPTIHMNRQYVDNKHNHVKLNKQFSQFVIQSNFTEAQNTFKSMFTLMQIEMALEQKNNFDQQGYTPLYLTTLACIKDPIKALSLLKTIIRDKETNIMKRNSIGAKPLEQAILFKSLPTLTNLFRSSYLQKSSQIKKSLGQIVSELQKLPDFYLELYVKVGSFVPLIDNFTPDDTIKIYKSGKLLRIDYTLVGYTFLQTKRRNMSCVLQQQNDGNYTILGINHDKKTYTDLLDPLQNEELVLMIQDMLCTDLKRTNSTITKTSLSRDLNIFNGIIRDQIGPHIATKHTVTVSYQSKTQKLKPNSLNPQQNLQFLKSWEVYNTHSVATNSSKAKEKQIKLGVWLCDKPLLQLGQFMEIMKFLSFANESGQIVYDFLSSEKIIKVFNNFPARMEIPINFSLFLGINVTQIKCISPQIQFDYTNKYSRMRRSEYQKTLQRRQKRLAFIKIYT